MEPRRKREIFLILLAAAVAVVAGLLYLYSNLSFTDGFLTLPLDDAYIFLQYARNLAAGHPFVYNVGDPPTTGFTSYLYLLILTPLALALHGPDALVWATFVLNVAFYGVSIWLFAKIAENLFEGRYVVVSTLIFATTGPITFHALGGMDTGLYILALLFAVYTYIILGEYGHVAPFVAALAALTLARPEGIIAAAILAVLALMGPANRRSKWLVLTGLALVPAYFAANYLVGGYVTSSSFLSKSILNYGNPPWPARSALVLSRTVYVVKSVLAASDGHYVKGLFNANIIQAAANYFAPLALAFFLVGWGRAARKSWSNRKPSPPFAAGVVFLACVAAACIALPFPGHFERYIVPYFPLFVIGVLGGIDGLAHLSRYGRPTISHGAIFWAGAGYFLAFGLITSPYFCVAYGMSARDIRYQHIAVARYIRANVPAAANIFTHDVGALAYYGGHRIVDSEGLVTREGWRYGHEGLGGCAEFVRRRGKRGDYFVGYFEQYPLDESGGVSAADYSARLFTTTIAGRPEMSVARFIDDVFEPSPPPSPPFTGFDLVDEINVADATSESAHDYRLRRRAANDLEGYASARPLWGAPGVTVFEGGRAVCGVEEFTVNVVAGRDLVAAVRCEPPFAAEVRVNGKNAGKWAVRPVGAEVFRDAFFTIPARYVASDRLRISLKTLSEDLTYNGPAHYYFYSRAE